MPEITLTKKEIQNRLNTIKINPDGLNDRQYGVTIKYYSNEDVVPKKRIDYEIKTSFEQLNGIGYITIDKENIFYNQHEPDLINEIIADAISKSIYPIKTHFNEKGITSNEIVNHLEILERWKSQKNKILQKYKSDELHSFFDITDEMFSNKKQLGNNLQYDWLWNLFFHPKLINYGEKRTANTELYLSIIPYKIPFRFLGTQKIEKIPTDYHSFKINFESEELKAPKYFYPKKNEETNTLYMTLKVEFDMDVYHHFPMHTRAFFNIFSKEWNGEKKIIKRIVLTVYQTNLQEYDNKILSDESPFITGGIVKVPTNKWGFDNFDNLENDW